MADEKTAGDDVMKSSANALTDKLYLTVMDVYGHYAFAQDDEYEKMLETLRNKKMKKKSLSPSSSIGTRGVITKKLLAGYSLAGGVCEKCVMPLMAYEGHVSCVVCSDAEDNSSPAPPTPSLDEEENNAILVNKEMSQINERRSQVTEVYASKMLAGYEMQHNELCSECDMPMMKYNNSIDCIFCTKEVVKEDPPGTVDEPANEIIVLESTPKPTEPPKPVRVLSQAEIVAERLRATQNDRTEKSESELDKAENEILKLLGDLGMQGSQSGEVTEAIQDYFSMKKQDRVAAKRLKEVENGIINADSVSVSEQEAFPMIMPIQAKPVIVTTGDISNESTAPATPQVKPSISCSMGNSFFPSLRSMFASASDPIEDDAKDTKVNATALPASRSEAKERIATLVAEGWEISDGCCPRCDLPLFSNSNGRVVNGLKRCVMCGPTSQNGKTGPMQMDGEMHEVISKKMANRIMEGWSIVDGSECPSCKIPTMLDPQTRVTHCIACEVVKERGMMFTTNSFTESLGSAVVKIEPELDTSKKMVDKIMEGWIVVEGSQCPSCYMPTMLDPRTQHIHCVGCGILDEDKMKQRAQSKSQGSSALRIHSVQNKLRTLAVSENTDPNPHGRDRSHRLHAMQNKLMLKTLPDPTPCVYDFNGNSRGKPVDPTPSVQVLKAKFNVATQNRICNAARALPAKSQLLVLTEQTTHARNTRGCDPTPAMGYKQNDPTPNMKAVWKKYNY